jgi:hypothetical protein
VSASKPARAPARIREIASPGLKKFLQHLWILFLHRLGSGSIAESILHSRPVFRGRFF